MCAGTTSTGRTRPDSANDDGARYRVSSGRHSCARNAAHFLACVYDGGWTSNRGWNDQREPGPGGALSVSLVPNANATPANTVYTVVYQLDDPL